MLDLAKGERVRLRNKSIARVQHNDERKITLSVLALNGFGDVLWQEPGFKVSAITGHFSKSPHPQDIVAKARVKGGFFSYKVIESPIGLYLPEPTQ